MTRTEAARLANVAGQTWGRLGGPRPLPLACQGLGCYRLALAQGAAAWAREALALARA